MPASWRKTTIRESASRLPMKLVNGRLPQHRLDEKSDGGHKPGQRSSPAVTSSNQTYTRRYENRRL